MIFVFVLDLGLGEGAGGVVVDLRGVEGQLSQTNSTPACGCVGAVSGFLGRPTSFFLRDVVHCRASLAQREQDDERLLLRKHFSFRAWHLSHARPCFAIMTVLRCVSPSGISED